LAKVTAANVRNMSLAWLYDLPVAGTIKATPLQVGGALYFTTPNHVYAVDARTGQERWHFTFARSRGGIQIGNRGSPSTSRPARRSGRRSSARSR
jgi:alcohol dehydrogenase (cytochrome c)